MPPDSVCHHCTITSTYFGSSSIPHQTRSVSSVAASVGRYQGKARTPTRQLGVIQYRALQQINRFLGRVVVLFFIGAAHDEFRRWRIPNCRVFAGLPEPGRVLLPAWLMLIPVVSPREDRRAFVPDDLLRVKEVDPEQALLLALVIRHEILLLRKIRHTAAEEVAPQHAAVASRNHGSSSRPKDFPVPPQVCAMSVRLNVRGRSGAQP